jgi:hypothetical protein
MACGYAGGGGYASDHIDGRDLQLKLVERGLRAGHSNYGEGIIASAIADLSRRQAGPISPRDATRTGTLSLPAGTVSHARVRIYGLLVEDNELAPRFVAGDTVIADPAGPPKSGDHVVVWPTELERAPLHQLMLPGFGADKTEPSVTMHKVVGVWRPE